MTPLYLVFSLPRHALQEPVFTIETTYMQVLYSAHGSKRTAQAAVNILHRRDAKRLCGRMKVPTVRADGNGIKLRLCLEEISDLQYRVDGDPFNLGSAAISIGNGNPSYSSLFVDQIQDSLKNKGISFEDISLNYYKDYYIKL